MFKRTKNDINKLISLIYIYQKRGYDKREIYELLKAKGYSYPTIFKYYNDMIKDKEINNNMQIELENKLKQIEEAIK